MNLKGTLFKTEKALSLMLTASVMLSFSFSYASATRPATMPATAQAPVKAKASVPEFQSVRTEASVDYNISTVGNSGPSSDGKMATQISNVMDQMDMADTCDAFVEDDNIEKWGKEVLSSMNPSDHGALYNGAADLSVQCPNYDNLTMREKEYVWLLILTSMANAESSCRTNKPNRGAPHGIAVGLFQFHNWGPRNDPQCPRTSMTNAGASIDCALEMLDDQLRRSNRLFSNASYWGVLRAKGDVIRRKGKAVRVTPYTKIARAINKLPVCKKR
jgi:hypothetical protein